MYTPLLLALSFLCVGTERLPNRPDKFWLDDGKQANTEASAPRCIEGVLLPDSDDTTFHIRVEGGELWLPKAMVVKVEKDGLTVATIQASERKAQEERAAQAKADAAAQAAAAAAAKNAAPAVAKPEDADVVEAVLAEPAEVELDDVTFVEDRPRYDPVLHTFHGARQSPDQKLLRDLELAYELTHDRSYLKMLRKLRRLR